LYLACVRARKPHHLIKITKAMQSDILTWKISAIGTPNCKQTSVKVFINFEQLLVLSAPANKKSSR
jgi:hypothetical protein